MKVLLILSVIFVAKAQAKGYTLKQRMQESNYDNDYKYDHDDDDYDHADSYEELGEIYDFERLFAFPGSNFMEEALEYYFSNEDVWQRPFVQGPNSTHTFLVVSVLQALGKFREVYPDEYPSMVATLVTRATIREVLNTRARCPATYIDLAMESSLMMDVSHAYNFQEGTVQHDIKEMLAETLDLDQNMSRIISNEAAVEMQKVMYEKSLHILFGGAFLDVARASHVMYRKIVEWVKTGSASDLSKVITASLAEAKVECPSIEELQYRHHLIANLFMEEFEGVSPGIVCHHVFEFLYERNVNFSENKLRPLCFTIASYFHETMKWFFNYNQHLESANLPELMNIFSKHLDDAHVTKVVDAFKLLGLKLK